MPFGTSIPEYAINPSIKLNGETVCSSYNKGYSVANTEKVTVGLLRSPGESACGEHQKKMPVVSTRRKGRWVYRECEG